MSIEIKKQIVEVSKLMYEKGMVNAFEGNLSVIEDGKVYITPSAICKGFLSEDMIVTTDIDGNVINGKYKPSSEIKMHLAAYKCRPDIKSVIHAHSPYATAYAIVNQPIQTKAYPEMIVLYDKIPVVPYGTPSTDEIHNGFKQYLNNNDVVLLANHGIISVGPDIYSTFFKLESVESIAKVLTITKLIGKEKELCEDNLQKLYQLREKNK